MRIIKLAVSLFVLSSVSAHAADLPSIKSAPIPAPAPMWTGFYAGLNAGGTWATNNNAQINYGTVYSDPRNSSARNVSNIASILSSYSVPTNSASGFTGGGQIGFNSIIKTNYLIGLETDFQGMSDFNGYRPVSYQSTIFGFYSNALQKFTYDTLSNIVSANKNVSALGTARIRLGYLITPKLLVYGTGGLAYGLSNYSSYAVQDLISPVTDPIGPGGSNHSVFRLGWAAGGGFEWMLINNWSLKTEYLYYDLGTTSMFMGQGVAVQRVQTTTSGIASGEIAQMRNAYSNMHFTGNIVRLGVNYHFNFASEPVVAKF